MKLSTRILTKILACLALAVGAYFFATGLMDSLFAYRSPLKDNLPAAGQPLDTALIARLRAH
jgi:hypothetical protein